MEQYIVNGKVFLDGSFQEKTIGVEGGCIRILPKDADLEGGAKVYDAEGKKVVPGFLDIHTYGDPGNHFLALFRADGYERADFMVHRRVQKA